MTRSEVRQAEKFLRRDDKALRLRVDEQHPHILLIERKTFRGRIGKMLMGLPFPQKAAGRRREEGHVFVAHLIAVGVNARDLRHQLQAADTWRHKNRLWQRVESQDLLYSGSKAISKMQEHEHRASQLFDRYVWKHKQRVGVPVQIG